MGSILPPYAFQVRVDASREMMFQVSQDCGATVEHLMSDFHRYIRKDGVYPYRIKFGPRFGRVPTDPDIFGEGFSVTPWREHLPGVAPVQPTGEPHHDICDIERYLRGCSVEQREKYDILWRADKLWGVYQDCLTTLKIRYFHHQLKRWGELCGVRVPSLPRCVEMVNLLAFGLPYDPRINPLNLPLDQLEAGVFDAAPGSAVGPPVKLRRILASGYEGYFAEENRYPELWGFLGFIDAVWKSRSPWVAGAQPANVFRVTMKDALQNQLFSLPAPGASTHADTEVWHRWFMRLDHNSASASMHSQFYGANNRATSLQEELRDLTWFLLGGDEISPLLMTQVELHFLRDLDVQYERTYSGVPVVDFSGLRYWAYVADCNSGTSNRTSPRALLHDAYLCRWKFTPRRISELSKRLHRSGKWEWRGEKLDSLEMCHRFFLYLSKSFGIDLKSE